MASSTELVNQILQLDTKFPRSLQQVVLLNSQVSDLKQRYKRAVKVKSKGFRCSLRLRIASYEGVRNIMYEYANRKCDEIEELQDQLRAQFDSDYEIDTQSDC
jgi:uncharacterized alpha-E superfamily protein